MSYEWNRRRTRDLSFRYLFPKLVAPWILLKRWLLRVHWFITHPVDEFFETIGEMIVWPFATLAALFAWMSAAIRDFLRDLLKGIATLFRYLGRLPVWTGAAISGSLGVILTTLLFLPLMQYRPVTVSISSDSGPVPQSPLKAPAQSPLADVAELFDPFAGAKATTPAEPAWRPTPTPSVFVELSVHIERLSMPVGWDARRRMEVVSTSTQQRSAWPVQNQDPPRLELANDGWRRAGVDRTDRPTPLSSFTPYVSRFSVRATDTAPRWITIADSVSTPQPVNSQSHPAVSIARTAPKAAQIGELLKYELIVRNLGTEPLSSVIVREEVSAMDRVKDAHPAAAVVGNTLVWMIPNLLPKGQQRIVIELQPDQLVPVTGGSTVQVTTGIAAVTRITAPRPEPLVMTPEPTEEPLALEQAPAAEKSELVLPSFDEESPSEPAPAEPAEPPRQPPAFLPITLGDEPQAVLPARATEVPEVAASTGDVPIHFELRLPKLVSPDAPVPAVFEIRNPGTSALTDLAIQVQMTDQLHHAQGRVLRHRIGRLPPGDVYRTRLTTRAVGDGKARMLSTLTAGDDVKSEAEAAVEIGHPPGSRRALRSRGRPPGPLLCRP